MRIFIFFFISILLLISCSNKEEEVIKTPTSKNQALAIYKEGLKVSSHNKTLKNYIKAREKAENKENLFLEKIADKDTTKDEMIENLKNVLIANGWTYKEDKNE